MDTADLHTFPLGWTSLCLDVPRVCALLWEHDWTVHSWGTQLVAMETNSTSLGSGGCHQQLIQMFHRKHITLCNTHDLSWEKGLSQLLKVSIFLWSLGWGRNEIRLLYNNTAKWLISDPPLSLDIPRCGERERLSSSLEEAVWLTFHLLVTYTGSVLTYF